MRVFAFSQSALSICYAASLLKFPSVPLPLSSLLDNQAASSDGSADFDGEGSSFDSQFLPQGTWNYDGIDYELPSVWGTGNDNFIANGQVLTLAQPSYTHEIHLLYAGDGSGGAFVSDFELTFADNSSQTIQLYARNWWMWPNLNIGVIQTPYHFEDSGTTKNFNSTQIYQWSTSIFSEQALKSITLPRVGSSQRLHLFAISFTPSTLPGENSRPALSVRQARFTTRWELIDGIRAQAVEVTLANLLPAFTLSSATSVHSELLVSIEGAGIETTSPGSIYRLVPSDQARVDVFITGSTVGGQATVRLRNTSGEDLGSSEGWATAPLIEEWTPDAAVLRMHETPSWWNGAKFGIFIHWGVYSYPAWGPPTSYAEWYDWDLHQIDSPTYHHHLDTYGPDVVYDDFIPHFTASKFNASAWVDLFDKAGAQYFKHHDGFALFDTGDTTHRSSVYLGPKRDFLSELFTTAKNEKPHLHRGTYYSLPEWFSPDFGPYGFSSWPGHLAHNAFNNSELEPYTGRLPITDYLDNLQLPHMMALAYQYETEIMWCDIGGPNKTLDFAAQYYNHAWGEGRQVTMNNRCAAVPDFETPEYATFGSTQTGSWESNEGMDPFSYGYNSVTLASQYKNASDIVQTLVDIVSKNGNYLLDVGPTAEGEIIAPEMDNLLDAGTWLKYSGDCIYNTVGGEFHRSDTALTWANTQTYWFPIPQEVVPEQSLRFTTTPKTFCFVAFNQPSGGTLTIQKRLPIMPGDTIRLFGPGGAGAVLPWSVDNTGRLNVNISDDVVSEGRFAWAFQISYSID
ncbi:hypothetical protein H2248_004283 [Termitomyces sp. 'cryptogamus']|nr:hypothetical protein H2248_004283 [Termitomyces sp. 'cryptogamus']